MAKAGRKRKLGKRFGNGQLVSLKQKKKDVTVVEARRRKVAGDAWHTADAGTIWGLLYLKGTLSREQKEIVDNFVYWRNCYLKISGANALKCNTILNKMISSNTIVFFEHSDDFIKKVEKNYLDLLERLRSCGLKVFKAFIGMIDDNYVDNLEYILDAVKKLK